MTAEGFEIEQHGSVVTVRFHMPELNHAQMLEVEQECIERLRCHNGAYILMDMAGVQFLSSACLGPLVSLLQDLEHVRGRMAMTHCEDNVAFLFRVTKLDALLELFDDEQTALASF